MGPDDVGASPLISLLPKSKYTTRLASRPPFGARSPSPFAPFAGTVSTATRCRTNPLQLRTPAVAAIPGMLLPHAARPRQGPTEQPEFYAYTLSKIPSASWRRFLLTLTQDCGLLLNKRPPVGLAHRTLLGPLSAAVRPSTISAREPRLPSRSRVHERPPGWGQISRLVRWPRESTDGSAREFLHCRFRVTVVERHHGDCDPSADTRGPRIVLPPR